MHIDDLLVMNSVHAQNTCVRFYWFKRMIAHLYNTMVNPEDEGEWYEGVVVNYVHGERLQARDHPYIELSERYVTHVHRHLYHAHTGHIWEAKGLHVWGDDFSYGVDIDHSYVIPDIPTYRLMRLMGCGVHIDKSMVFTVDPLCTLLLSKLERSRSYAKLLPEELFMELLKYIVYDECYKSARAAWDAYTGGNPKPLAPSF